MQKIICDNIILFGGGIDSSCLANYLYQKGKKFKLLYINYNQKALVGELESAKHFAKLFNSDLIVLKTNAYNDSKNPLLNGKVAINHSKNVLAVRNQLFLTIATIYAINNNIKNIYLGFHKEPKGSKFHDAKKKFVDCYQELLRSQKLNIKIRVPFIKQTQLSYITKNKSLISKSFSCYESKGKKECGKCTHCKHKKKLCTIS